jgi:hypothetical protein
MKDIWKTYRGLKPEKFLLEMLYALSCLHQKEYGIS